MRRIEIGRNRQRATQALERSVFPTQRNEQVAPIAERQRVGWVEFDRALIARQCLRGSAELAEYHRPITPGMRMIRREFQGAIVACEGGCKFPAVLQQIGVAVMGRRAVYRILRHQAFFSSTSSELAG